MDIGVIQSSFKENIQLFRPDEYETKLLNSHLYYSCNTRKGKV